MSIASTHCIHAQDFETGRCLTSLALVRLQGCSLLRVRTCSMLRPRLTLQLVVGHAARLILFCRPL